MRQRIKKIWFYATWFLRYSLLTFFYLIISFPLRFNKKYKDLWLISERPDEARDNGFWLYKWILENHPEMNVRYVLSKDSADYEKMPRKDLIIKPNSAQHYIAHILSTRSISTHMHGACPGKSFCIPYLPFMRKKKTVFLQHGITQNKINLRGRLDIITAAAKEEKDLLIEANPKYKNQIYLTGFCRYDYLNDESINEKEKIILVMPTFRKWLRDIGRIKESDSVFKKTDYYKAWNDFLNEENLGKILDENNLKLIFFPHNEIQKMAHNFHVNNKRIIIGKPGEFDIQALLKKASLLITDYSSVFFDFTYMKKPVVFYQFDQKDFYSKHYKSGEKKNLFGEIVISELDLMNRVKEYTGNGFSLEPKCSEAINNFFYYHDRSNCERVFSLIKGGNYEE